MAIRFIHDAPGLVASFAAGQARGQERRSKYALDRIDQKRREEQQMLLRQQERQQQLNDRAAQNELEDARFDKRFAMEQQAIKENRVLTNRNRIQADRRAADARFKERQQQGQVRAYETVANLPGLPAGATPEDIAKAKALREQIAANAEKIYVPQEDTIISRLSSGLGAAFGPLPATATADEKSVLGRLSNGIKALTGLGFDQNEPDVQEKAAQLMGDFNSLITNINTREAKAKTELQQQQATADAQQDRMRQDEQQHNRYSNFMKNAQRSSIDTGTTWDEEAQRKASQEFFMQEQMYKEGLQPASPTLGPPVEQPPTAPSTQPPVAQPLAQAQQPATPAQSTAQDDLPNSLFGPKETWQPWASGGGQVAFGRSWEDQKKDYVLHPKAVVSKFDDKYAVAVKNVNGDGRYEHITFNDEKSAKQFLNDLKKQQPATIQQPKAPVLGTPQTKQQKRMQDIQYQHGGNANNVPTDQLEEWLRMYGSR